MQRLHGPLVDARYWTAITLASIFGTNLGDFYAHESGLGIVKGLLLLAVVAAIAFAVEPFDRRRHQVYYWLVIILIRTGATNIADYLAFHVRIPPAALVGGLILLLCLFGWGTHRGSRDKDDIHRLPSTNAAYWLAMLTAGVFGTVVGDLASDAIGQGPASLVLGALLLIVLFAGRGRAAQVIALYWATVAVARTAGTSMGDWLAENKILHIGLPISTLISGLTFLAVLLFWHSQPAPRQFVEEPTAERL